MRLAGLILRFSVFFNLIPFPSARIPLFFFSFSFLSTLLTTPPPSRAQFLMFLLIIQQKTHFMIFSMFQSPKHMRSKRGFTEHNILLQRTSKISYMLLNISSRFTSQSPTHIPASPRPAHPTLLVLLFVFLGQSTFLSPLLGLTVH